MLTFQPAQMVLIGESVRARYAAELAAHARGFTPRLCEVAGVPAVQKIAALAIERALAVHWDEKHLVRFYLELMLTLGCDFAADPQYPWVCGHLQPSEIEDSHTLACRLYADFDVYCAAVYGPDQRHALAALVRLGGIDFSELSSAASQVHEALRVNLLRLYPEKAPWCDALALRWLADRAATHAVAFELPSGTGATTLGMLMLAFGAGVCNDPLYPWIAAVLADGRIDDPQARLARLWRKVGTYAEHAARYLAAVA